MSPSVVLWPAVAGVAFASPVPSDATASLSPVGEPQPLEDAAFFALAGGECFDGPAREVEGALAFLKAGPRGGLFRRTWAKVGYCSDLYRYSQAHLQRERAHTCYPNVTEHFVSDLHIQEYDQRQLHAVGIYAETFSIVPAHAHRLASCSCHPESIVGRLAAADPTTCNVTELGVGSMTHTDERSMLNAGEPEAEGRSTRGRELLCNQGPWQHQLAVLATIKSSPLVFMHPRDALEPVGCEERGFPAYLGVATPPMPTLPFGEIVDHCYPPSTLWARQEINATNTDVTRSLEIEDQILGRNGHEPLIGTFIATRGLRNATYWQNTPECNCLPGSDVFQGVDPSAGPDVPAMCDYNTRLAETHSPVRDWWRGYEWMPGPIDPGSPQLQQVQRAAKRRAAAMRRAR